MWTIDPSVVFNSAALPGFGATEPFDGYENMNSRQAPFHLRSPFRLFGFDTWWRSTRCLLFVVFYLAA
jgi:hypothetical protein